MDHENSMERLMRRRRESLESIAHWSKAAAAGNTVTAPAATARVVAEEKALDEIDAALLQADNTEALNREGAARERRKAEQDDAQFWFRRFMVSLQIGNGAALLSTISGVLGAERIEIVAPAASAPAESFAGGLVFAGLIPAILWADRQTWALSEMIVQSSRKVQVGRNPHPNQINTVAFVRTFFQLATFVASIISAYLFINGVRFVVVSLGRVSSST